MSEPHFASLEVSARYTLCFVLRALERADRYGALGVWGKDDGDDGKDKLRTWRASMHALSCYAVCGSRLISIL